VRSILRTGRTLPTFPGAACSCSIERLRPWLPAERSLDSVSVEPPKGAEITDTIAHPRPHQEPWFAISPAEFRDRQQRVREAAAAAGFDGAIVWSRGGAFMDMSADVLWLTNHYSQQPYMGDEAGIGSARSHGVCVLPVNGPTTVV